MTEELKPCPFCGNPGEVVEWRDTWIARCEDVDGECCFQSNGWKAEHFAIAAWNRRAPAAQPAQKQGEPK